MDSHLVAHVLANTFNPDATVRNESESRLAALELQPGFASSLLQIAVVLPADQLPIKQAAVLRLKHLIRQHWDLDRDWGETKQEEEAEEEEEDGKQAAAAASEPSPLSEQDRSVIRSNMFAAIVHQSSPLLRVQLLECVVAMLRAERAEAWPELLPAILATLRSGDGHRMHAALLVLCVLYKRWLFVSGKDRNAVVDALTAAVMPVLLPIFQHAAGQDSAEACDMLAVLCKIFFLSTQMRISPALRPAASALPFYQLLIATLQRPTPQPLLVAFTASTSLPPHKHPLWKAKKWALHALVRSFSRWGQPAQVKEKALKPFAAFFSAKVAPPAFAAIIAVLRERKEGQWVSSRVCQLSFVFLSYSLRSPELRRLLQRNLSFLIRDCVLPVLCLTADDIRLFLHDPHEFIRQSLDLAEEFHDPRVAAANLLVDLVKADARRQSSEALTLSLQLVASLCAAQAERRDSEEAIVMKEGALRLLGALRPVLLKEEAMLPTVESLLAQYAVPELSSPHGFMRSRALHLLGRYSKLDWQDSERQADSIVRVCSCLHPSNALPVRLEAAACISRLVRNEAVLSFIQPQIPLVLSTFFSLMDEIGTEDVISTMQTLLGHIGEEVEPFAAEIVQRLTSMCLQLLHAQDDDDESRLAAAEGLRTISAVFYALGPKPAVVNAIEPITHPLITAVCLSGDDSAQEFFEDGVELVHCIIDHAAAISPFMWRAFPALVAAYYSFASDYLQHIAAVTDLYTAQGGEAFVSGSRVVTGDAAEEGSSGLDIVTRLVLHIWRGGEQGPQDDTQAVAQQYACKMLESVLAHHRGRVDFLLPLLLRLVTGPLLAVTARKEKKQWTPLILSLLDVLAGLCYYSPAAFIALLQSAQLLQPVFNVWMSYVDSAAIATSFHHQRMAVIALSSLSCLPLSSLPAVLRDAFPEVVTLQVKRLAGLIELYRLADEEERQEEEEFQANGADDADDDDDFDGEIWTGDAEDEEAAAGAAEGGGGRQGGRQGARGGGDDGKAMAQGKDEEGAEEAEGEEEGGDGDMRQWEDWAREHDQQEVDEAHFPSPLDDVDEFVAFEQQMQRLREREPDWFRRYDGGLKKEKKVGEAYEAVMAKAKEMREKQEEERRKEAEGEESKAGDEEKSA